MRIVAICTVILIPLLALGDDADMSPSILDVKKQHEAQFLKMAGVVSVGIGLDSDGNQAIVVGLDGSHPDTESSIPATLEGFPVVVQTIGSIQAQ
jgi:hypothetical protein